MGHRGGGRVVRWCWVNFQFRPTIRITVGQGSIAFAVGVGGGCLDIFTLIYPFSPLSPSLWDTARYRLKYCLKGLLNPKQPTNQPQDENVYSTSHLKNRYMYFTKYAKKPGRARTSRSKSSTLTTTIPLLTLTL